MTELKRYYEVIAKCGHVGRNHYVPIKFPVAAENGRVAAKIARQIPRVKHDHKDAILSVKEIDYEKYLELIEINSNDPYLKCSSKHEQNAIYDLDSRLVIDNHNQKDEHDKVARIARVAHKLRKYRLIGNAAWEDNEYDYAY